MLWVIDLQHMTVCLLSWVGDLPSASKPPVVARTRERCLVEHVIHAKPAHVVLVYLEYWHCRLHWQYLTQAKISPSGGNPETPCIKKIAESAQNGMSPISAMCAYWLIDWLIDRQTDRTDYLNPLCTCAQKVMFFLPAASLQHLLVAGHMHKQSCQFRHVLQQVVW